MRNYIAALSLFLVQFAFAQEPLYKQMMYDLNVNFYTVCQEADNYFEANGRGEGSGFKGYMRWKNENESRYYPTGERNLVPADFPQQSFREYTQSLPEKLAQRNGYAPWQDLGPYDAENITTSYNPGIGRVEDFWVDPTDDNFIYMGSRSGGLWKSTDGGTTWINTTDTLFASGVNAIAVSPTNRDSVIINVRNASNGTTHGLYRSVNGGQSWKFSQFNPTRMGWGGLGDNARIYKVDYHPVIPNLILVGSSEGLYISTNNLDSIQRVISVANVTDFDFHPTNPAKIYAYSRGNPNVVYISSDSGKSFQIGGNVPGNGSREGFLAVTPAAPSHVYFASDNGVWISRDEALTFTFLTNPEEDCDGFSVSDVDTNLMVYGYVDIEATSDAGSSFQKVTDWSLSGTQMQGDYVHADLRIAECINGVFYIGTDGYLCSSKNGGISWARLNNGTGIREFYKLGVSQSKSGVAMLGSQDNGTSIITPSSWKEWNGGDGMEAVIQPLLSDWMIGSWQFGSRNLTLDGGETRMSANNPNGGGGNADWEAPMFLDPRNQLHVYHFGSEIYRSENFGQDDWQFVNNPGIGIITEAEIARNNSKIFIIAANGLMKITKDGGGSFDFIQGIPSHAPTDIAFALENDSIIAIVNNRYIDNGQKIFISTDLAATWQNHTYNLGNMPLKSVVIDRSAEPTIFVGAEIGAYYKSLSDTLWKPLGENLPNVTVNELEIQEATNTLYAASWGRGLWTIPLPGKENHPKIDDISVTTFPILNGSSGGEQFVMANIYHNAPITEAYTEWSSDTGGLYRIPMVNLFDDFYTAASPIPPQNSGISSYFEVVAIGQNQDTSRSYTFQYQSKGNPILQSRDDALIQSSFDEKFKLYPNPSEGEITLETEQDLGELYLNVFSAKGELVEQLNSKNTRQIQVDLKQQPNGLYFITITDNSGNKSILRCYIQH